jgi:hypothetical protein
LERKISDVTFCIGDAYIVGKQGCLPTSKKERNLEMVFYRKIEEKRQNASKNGRVRVSVGRNLRGKTRKIADKTVRF